MMRFYVYVHRRADTNAIFYVGSAGERVYPAPCKPYKRARDTNHERRTGPWRDEVEAAGGFTFEITQEYETDDDARAAELSLMASFPTGTLVNRRLQVIGWSADKRERHARRGDRHPNFGITFSEETRRKKSAAVSGDLHFLKGVTLPAEWVANLAAAKVGALNPRYGKTGAGATRSRPVIDTKTKAKYVSVTTAADAIGINMKTLYNMLSGHRPNRTSLKFA